MKIVSSAPLSKYLNYLVFQFVIFFNPLLVLDQILIDHPLTSHPFPDCCNNLIMICILKAKSIQNQDFGRVA